MKCLDYAQFNGKFGNILPVPALVIYHFCYYTQTTYGESGGCLLPQTDHIHLVTMKEAYYNSLVTVGGRIMDGVLIGFK
jgi:hypothetical protein